MNLFDRIIQMQNNMTKQEARKILLMEANVFKQMGLSSKQFISMLEDADIKMNINSPIIQAYLLIEAELPHIIALTWVGIYD